MLVWEEESLGFVETMAGYSELEVRNRSVEGHWAEMRFSSHLHRSGLCSRSSARAGRGQHRGHPAHRRNI